MTGDGRVVLALDPSSTVVGYGVVTMGRELIEAGLCEPEDRHAASYERVMDLCDDVERLCTRILPAVVLVEWTKGKVGQRHHGHGAGLAVYGAGVGAVTDRVRLWCRGRQVDWGVQLGPPKIPKPTMEAICENTWTRGVPKATRAMAIRQLYPALSAAEDPGMDMHDAVGLADWWLRNRLVR